MKMIIVPKPTPTLTREIIEMIRSGLGVDDIKVMTGASWLTLDRTLAPLITARPIFAAYHRMIPRRLRP